MLGLLAIMARCLRESKAFRRIAEAKADGLNNDRQRP
jgi:hypothetical protein